MIAEKFKLRASQAGLFMVNPKGKGEKLSAGAKSYLEDWAKEQIYGVKKEFSSRQTDKGNIVEQASIDAVIEWLDLPFFVKNEEHFEDEYFQGTPDGLPVGLVIDMKNSWNCFTFPLFEKKIPTKGYEGQLQVYMHLTGRKKAKLIYALMDTPSDLADAGEISYEHLPIDKRCKYFDLVYDRELIETLQERVIAAREYLRELLGE